MKLHHRSAGLALLLLSCGAPAWAQSAPPSLTQLCAPYALYPDTLLAQVLAAATFPDQLMAATLWCAGNPGQQPTDQPWDSSVKALCAFPDVLKKLTGDLNNTTLLGQDFQSDHASVMDCVQNLRAKAQSMGALSNNPQQTVVTNADVIQIQPATPDTLYVPSYNADYLTGAAAYPYGAGLLTYGAGVALGAAFNSNYGAFDWAGHSMYTGAAVRDAYYGGYHYAGCNTWAHTGGVYGSGGYHAGAYGVSGAYGQAGAFHTGSTQVYHGPMGGTDVAHTGTTAMGARGYGGAYGGATHTSFNAYHPPGGGVYGGYDSRSAARGYSSMGGYRGGSAHFGGGFRR